MIKDNNKKRITFMTFQDPPLPTWVSHETPIPRIGSFSSTHWIHGFDSSEAFYSEHEMHRDFTVEKETTTSDATLGLLLEGPIGHLAKEKISKQLELEDLGIRPGLTRSCEFKGVSFRDTCDFILDNRATSESYGLEVKTVSALSKQKRLYGDEWTDAVPLPVRFQCWAHMAANNLKRCFVAAWFYFPAPPTIYIIERPGKNCIESIMNKLIAWHGRHIVDGEMLPIDGSASCARYLQRIEQSEEDIILANDDDLFLMNDYVLAKKKSVEAKFELEGAKNNLKARIKSSAGIEFEGFGKVRWSGKKVRRMTDTLDMGE